MPPRLNRGYRPGAVPPWIPPQPAVVKPPLRRATATSADMPTPWMAGVCSGLSVHSGVSVTAIRWIVVVLAFFFGAGIMLYLWLAIMLPKDTYNSGAPSGTLASALKAVGEDRTRLANRNRLLLAGSIILIGAVGAAILAGAGVAEVRDIVSAGTVLIGIGLVWSQGTRLSTWKSLSFLIMVTSGIALVIVGIVGLVGRGDPGRILLRGGVIGAAVVAGVLFALIPLWIRTSKDLSASQEQQVRDAERADIAAHLHDSVLQTLTLIRASAEDPTRVRALALTEERELRSWLYTGREQAADSLAEAVRESVGVVEGRYGVPIDVVTVSDTRPGPGELALVAALGEAVANAVRHGSSPVSVYIEVMPTAIEAFIKDSGNGFNIDSIPDDRHGVRDSIIGRMERVGGSATIRCRESGTEVALRLPTTPQTPAQPVREGEQ